MILGKTALPELAIIGATESPTWGITRNPWDPERTTGGSSGGSGAAVAAGLCSTAHATDGAGSIRIPAANCGLVGMKPQRGRVSLMPDAQHWHGMSVAGAHTRTVADQALMLDVLSGPAEGDAHTPPPPPRPFAQAAAEAPGKLRVALSFKPTLPVPVADEVRSAVSSLADVIRSLGHEVVERDPAYNEIGTVFVPRYLKGIQADAEAVPRPHRLQRRTRGFAALGRLMPQAALDRALRDEARQAARINQIFDDVDVVLTPTTARPPVAAAEWEGLSAARTLLGMSLVYPFTAVWNATGQPVLSIPAGFTAAGLPLGAQLVGRPTGRGHPALPGGAGGGGAARGRTAAPPSRSFSACREIRIQDTLSGELRPLEPREPGKVGIYACGPTVYGRIHVGNARPYVVFALLKRFLEHEGLAVNLVVNVTDVNDKIYDAAREAGVPSAELAGRDDRPLRERHRRPRPRPARRRAARGGDDRPDRRPDLGPRRVRPRLSRGRRRVLPRLELR